MRRRTEIVIETERVMVVGRRGARVGVSLWCAGCGAEVEMVAAHEAAALAGVSERDIHHLVDAGRLHFSEAPTGRLFVCPNSLAATPRRRGPTHVNEPPRSKLCGVCVRRDSTTHAPAVRAAAADSDVKET
jgi:hypothetical protein